MRGTNTEQPPPRHKEAVLPNPLVSAGRRFGGFFGGGVGGWDARDPLGSAQTHTRTTSGVPRDLLVPGGGSWAWEKATATPGRAGLGGSGVWRWFRDIAGLLRREGGTGLPASGFPGWQSSGTPNRRSPGWSTWRPAPPLGGRGHLPPGDAPSSLAFSLVNLQPPPAAGKSLRGDRNGLCIHLTPPPVPTSFLPLAFVPGGSAPTRAAGVPRPPAPPHTCGGLRGREGALGRRGTGQRGGPRSCGRPRA
jgi:hypothetical protein